MALTKDLAIFRDETGADWHAALGCAFLTLLKRGEEPWICF